MVMRYERAVIKNLGKSRNIIYGRPPRLMHTVTTRNVIVPMPIVIKTYCVEIIDEYTSFNSSQISFNFW